LDVCQVKIIQALQKRTEAVSILKKEIMTGGGSSAELRGSFLFLVGLKY
jgi:hypothetical protein